MNPVVGAVRELYLQGYEAHGIAGILNMTELQVEGILDSLDKNYLDGWVLG